jgi:hypothetical protein
VRFRHGSFVAMIVVALLAWAASAVPARADRREASRLFAAAQKAAEKGEFLTAIRAFDASYAEEPHTHTLFATAQALRQQFQIDHNLAHAQRAVDLYRQFIEQDPQSSWRPTAREHLLELIEILGREPRSAPQPQSPQPTQLMITSTATGARVFFDGDANGELAPAIQIVPSGTHRVRVEAPGHQATEREVQAVEERLVVVDVPLEQLPGRIRIISEDGASVFIDGQLAGVTPFERDGVRPGRYQIAVAQRGQELWTGIVEVEPGRTGLAMANLTSSAQRKAATLTFVGAAGLGVASLAVGFAATRSDSKLSRMATDTNSERSTYDDELGRRNRLGTASNILLGLTGAALAVGAGLYWFDVPHAPSRTAAPIANSAEGQIP